MAIDNATLESWSPRALAILRIVLLCGFMAVAYFMAHGSQGNVLLPMLNQGELAVLYCFVFLYFVFSGAGAWSVDAMRRTRVAAPGMA